MRRASPSGPFVRWLPLILVVGREECIGLRRELGRTGWLPARREPAMRESIGPEINAGVAPRQRRNLAAEDGHVARFRRNGAQAIVS
jgi:hypothetical protein